MRTILFAFLTLALGLTVVGPVRGEGGIRGESLEPGVPVLVYHRFGPVVTDSMTVTSARFESHLKDFRDRGYTVIPLRELVDHYHKKGAPIPSRSLVVTVDDGHRSVYTAMFPLIKKYRIPVTLFLYPSAISNAAYAMTWDQLREVQTTGVVDFQSHTYWHPNFEKEKQKLEPARYERFVAMQLGKSKERLENELDVTVDMLAWPFGIYDDALLYRAVEAGYVAGFNIEGRNTRVTDNMMALPRYLVVDSLEMTGSIIRSKNRR